jgi:hypothetical protein
MGRARKNLHAHVPSARPASSIGRAAGLRASRSGADQRGDHQGFLLGDDALRLYTEMFLDSGAMEMAWLWPSTRVFAGAEDPARTLTDYVEAYVEASTALGVMVASFKRQQQGFEVEVGRCRYAEILAALGCAELGGLVREMEVRAIRDLAVACHLEASWNPGSADGAGKLVIAPPRPASVASSALSEAAQ